MLHAPDRLVKRLVPAGAARLPAGMARLVDQPPLSLLVVVNEDVAAIGEQAPADAPGPGDGGHDEPLAEPAAEAPAIREETPPENSRPAPAQPGFAGKAEDLAGADGEGDVVEGPEAAVVLGQVMGFEQHEQKAAWP